MESLYLKRDFLPDFLICVAYHQWQNGAEKQRDTQQERDTEEERE